MQVCVGCKRELDDAQFAWRNRALGKRHTRCRECFAGYHRTRKPRTGGVVELGVSRKCSACLQALPLDQFHQNRDAPDGCLSRCKTCVSPDSKQRHKQRYAADPEKRRIESRFYFRKSDKFTVNAKRRQRYAAKRTQYVTYGQRRRAKQLQAGDDISAEQWAALIEEHDHRCAYCLRRVNILELDHVLPLVNDGKHEINNAVPACKSCNTSKGARGPLDILMRPGLLVTQRMLGI